METELAKFLIQQGGLAIVAVVAIWQMRVWHVESVKRNKEYLDDEIARGKENVDRERQDKSILIETLTKNTDSNTNLVSAILRVDRHIDSLHRQVQTIDRKEGGP